MRERYLNSPPTVEKPTETALALNYADGKFDTLFEAACVSDGLALIAYCRRLLDAKENELLNIFGPIKWIPQIFLLGFGLFLISARNDCKESIALFSINDLFVMFFNNLNGVSHIFGQISFMGSLR